ncbi:MAG: hypothetical protein R3C11_16110 [Planctomycetaceae bacterium]
MLDRNREIFVLLICEDPQDSQIIRYLLADSSRVKFVLATVRTVDEAMAMLLENEYDVLLLDLKMSHEDVLAPFREIRKSRHGYPSSLSAKMMMTKSLMRLSGTARRITSSDQNSIRLCLSMPCGMPLTEKKPSRNSAQRRSAISR